MKIAYVVPYVPNKIRTRPYNLISCLSKLGHEVDVFTVGSSRLDQCDADALRLNCHKVYYQQQPVWQSLANSILALPSGKPLQSVYSWQPKLATQLKTLLNESNGNHNAYDIVHIEHLRGSAYGTFVKSQYPSMPVIWDSVDCISYLFKQAAGESSSVFGKWMSRFELERTFKAEGELIRVFDHVLVTSDKDKEALLSTLPDGEKSAPISIISNGVDLEYFCINPEIDRDPSTIVFSGKMSYHANISMVKYLYNEIMPRVWEKYPAIRLMVVGKDPPAEIRKLSDSDHVQVTGTVDDIRPFLWKATAAVVPLVYGAGVQNKVLEAMATGTAVITNSRALGNLLAVPGRDVLIGDTPGDFANNILEIIENPSRRRAIGDMGLHYVKNHHDWKEIARQMAVIYEQAAV